MGHLADIGHVGEHGNEAVEQTQTHLAQGRVVIHDEHGVEEVVDGRAQTCKRLDGIKMSAIRKGGRNRVTGSSNGIGQRKLLCLHDRCVSIAAKGGIGKICRARVSRRQVFEDFGLLVTRCLKRIDARQRLGRLEHSRRHDGGDAIGRVAAVACDDLETRREEGAHLLAHLVEVEIDHVAIIIERNVNELGKRDVEAIEQDVDDADGGATQREGIGRTRGPRANREDATDGIELVRERGDGARKVARQLVAGKTRTIVIGDAEGDLGVSPEKRA